MSCWIFLCFFFKITATSFIYSILNGWSTIFNMFSVDNIIEKTHLWWLCKKIFVSFQMVDKYYRDNDMNIHEYVVDQALCFIITLYLYIMLLTFSHFIFDRKFAYTICLWFKKKHFKGCGSLVIQSTCWFKDVPFNLMVVKSSIIQIHQQQKTIFQMAHL